MKKLLIVTLAAVGVAVGAKAQNFEKGDWMIKADVSNLQLTQSFSDGLSLTSFDVGVNAGYFLANRFAVEAALGLDYSKMKGSDGVADFSFIAGARYYPVDNLFAKVGYYGYVSDGSKVRSLLGAWVGYDLFLSENVFLEPAVVYTRHLIEGGSNNLGLSLGFGVRF